MSETDTSGAARAARPLRRDDIAERAALMADSCSRHAEAARMRLRGDDATAVEAAAKDLYDQAQAVEVER